MTRKEIDEQLLKGHSAEMQEGFRRSRKELREKARREYKNKHLRNVPPDRTGPG
jgi:hypothetical protein